MVTNQEFAERLIKEVLYEESHYQDKVLKTVKEIRRNAIEKCIETVDLAYYDYGNCSCSKEVYQKIRSALLILLE